MAKAPHNIICLEAEWLLIKSTNKFSLRTVDLLNFFSDFYGCDFIHRVVPTNSTLRYYLDYFEKEQRKKRSKLASYDVVYICSHGTKGKICLENDVTEFSEKRENDCDDEWNGFVSLTQLAETYPDFFKGKYVHFSSCSTLADETEVRNFLKITKAKMVSGYCSDVLAMQSAITDLILFDAIMNNERVGNLNSERSLFRKNYGKILDELKFKMYLA